MVQTYFFLHVPQPLTALCDVIGYKCRLRTIWSSISCCVIAVVFCRVLIRIWVGNMLRTDPKPNEIILDVHHRCIVFCVLGVSGRRRAGTTRCPVSWTCWSSTASTTGRRCLSDTSRSSTICTSSARIGRRRALRWKNRSVFKQIPVSSRIIRLPAGY